MAERKYINFIEKLVEQTKENSIKWAYLDSNLQLCKKMNWVYDDNGFTAMAAALSGKSNQSFEFDAEHSFYCKIESNYIVLYVADRNPVIMLVIPPTFKNIARFSPDEYGDSVTRLHNLVESHFPSADAFITTYLLDTND